MTHEEKVQASRSRVEAWRNNPSYYEDDDTNAPCVQACCNAIAFLDEVAREDDRCRSVYARLFGQHDGVTLHDTSLSPNGEVSVYFRDGADASWTVSFEENGTRVLWFRGGTLVRHTLYPERVV